MGGVCSGGTTKRSIKPEGNSTLGFSGKLKKTNSAVKPKEKSYSYSDAYNSGKTQQTYGPDDRRLSFSSELKPSTPARTGVTKVAQKSSVIGRAGIVGLERAVEVLDTLGSSMSNLNASGGFISGVTRGNRISILAFEVANTIAKGANLFQSLSEENVQLLKKDILNSQGVQLLVSTDMKELLSIAASDKREELDVFSREVIRFGDLCKDPQWHNLHRFFSGLDSENSIHTQQRAGAEMAMRELTVLAQHTSELYHEFNSLDRFEQDYQQKVEEVEALNLQRRGESLKILHSELKQQRKLVKTLKKKSLWSRNLEEIVEKLVDIVTHTHQAISEAFGNNGLVFSANQRKDPSRLGIAGLALHYANVINQIDNIASRPTSLPPNMRDTLYNGLPNSVKTALRSRLQALDAKEQLSVSQIKAEMEKTLHWLVPVATNTNKAHQGFGWVGEWANSGPEFGKSTNAHNSMIRLQSLYHADKQKTDLYILELVTLLHQLIFIVRHKDNGSKLPPARSPTRKGVNLPGRMQRLLSLDFGIKSHKAQLSQEDRNLLDDVTGRRKGILGVSKSQEFIIVKKRDNRFWALSRSTGSSPNREMAARRNSEHCNNVLDVMDGLDTTF
ncbi:protein PSK SIMULATOR 2 [Humulus lupulus]|uniref:protein PSK SIMULATOR 2 n=1 Tax=Humulus lupulus TaxID=3486 RepID=UPI002B40560E|nr:protein PSK SIMULATOR 2 [Humulus lupulus]